MSSTKQIDDTDLEANALLQRDGYLVLASWEPEPIGKVVQGFGHFRHPVVVIGPATKEEFVRQHGPIPRNPYHTRRYFLKAVAE